MRGRPFCQKSSKEIAGNKKLKIREVTYKEGVKVTITLEEKDRGIIDQVLNLAPQGAQITIKGPYWLQNVYSILPIVKDGVFNIQSLFVIDTDYYEERTIFSVMTIANLTFGAYKYTAQIQKIIKFFNPQNIVFLNVTNDIEGVTAADWKEISKKYKLNYKILDRNPEKDKDNHYDTDKEHAENELKLWSASFDELKDAKEPQPYINAQLLLKGGDRCFTDENGKDRIATWNVFLEKRGE